MEREKTDCRTVCRNILRKRLFELEDDGTIDVFRRNHVMIIVDYVLHEVMWLTAIRGRLLQYDEELNGTELAEFIIERVEDV